jgi:hypothetical protein
MRKAPHSAKKLRIRAFLWRRNKNAANRHNRAETGVIKYIAGGRVLK